MIEELGIYKGSAPEPGLLVAGQLTESQLDALVLAGYTVVINLRLDAEPDTGWEEERLEGTVATYSSFPIATPADLTEETVRSIDALIGGADTRAILFCRSSNRCGAILALRAHWVLKKDAEEAFGIGKRTGMTGLSGPVRYLLGL